MSSYNLTRLDAFARAHGHIDFDRAVHGNGSTLAFAAASDWIGARVAEFADKFHPSASHEDCLVVHGDEFDTWLTQRFAEQAPTVTPLARRDAAAPATTQTPNPEF